MRGGGKVGISSTELIDLEHQGRTALVESATRVEIKLKEHRETNYIKGPGPFTIFDIFTSVQRVRFFPTPSPLLKAYTKNVDFSTLKKVWSIIYDAG